MYTLLPKCFLVSTRAACAMSSSKGRAAGESSAAKSSGVRLSWTKLGVHPLLCTCRNHKLPWLQRPDPSHRILALPYRADRSCGQCGFSSGLPEFLRLKCFHSNVHDSCSPPLNPQKACQWRRCAGAFFKGSAKTCQISAASCFNGFFECFCHQFHFRPVATAVFA